MWACERGVFVNAGGLHSNISSLRPWVWLLWKKWFQKRCCNNLFLGGGPRGVGVSRSTAKSILRLIGGSLMQQAFRNILHS